MIVITTAEFQQLLANFEIMRLDIRPPYMHLQLYDGFWVRLHENDMHQRLQQMQMDRFERDLQLMLDSGVMDVEGFEPDPEGFEPDHGPGDPLYA